ncbi:DUF4160 domain-containing protein [Azospirillum endophyticum]
MGKLMMFGKVALVIRNRDHNPPHFHVIGPDIDAMVGIDPLVLLRGTMPRLLWSQVESWGLANRAMLVAEWNRINPHFPMQ